MVGGGLAGLSAAIEATRVDRKLHVTILEKLDACGGNSAKASSGMSAAVTNTQLLNGVEDSPQEYLKDTLSSGDNLSDNALAMKLVANSPAAIDFLQAFGIPMDVLCQCGGHSHSRTHRSSSEPGSRPMNIGFRIMKTLREAVSEMERITIQHNTHVVKLITEEDGSRQVVRGVSVVVKDRDGKEDPQDLYADAVILSAGGWGADSDTEDSLLKEFRPDLAGMATTNGDFTKGEGVKMARAIGAGLVHMDKVQLHPTGFVDPRDPLAISRILAAEALRGSGGILLNATGLRFASELGRRDTVTHAILGEEGRFTMPQSVVREFEEKGLSLPDPESLPKVAYLVLDDEAETLFGKDQMGFYRFKKLITTFPNAEAVAEEFNLPAENVRSSLEAYRQQAVEGADPFGKSVFPSKFANGGDGPLHVGVIAPTIHYCMGGLAFDTEARILDTEGQPIPNLYGAGEVTGGLHGENRLAGNSLCECVVFGRAAGRSAAKGV